MKAINAILILVFVACYCSCTKQESICNILEEVIVTTSASQPCLPTGSIQVTQPLGSNYQYKLNNQPFVLQPIFLNVKVGKKIITVKDASGCEVVKEVMVDTVAQGNQFRQVMQVLNNYCNTCHSGNNPQGGLNFTNVCDVLNHWQRIDARAIQGNPSPMPQAGLMPLSERKKILDWINAGHSYNH
ncbi:MAG: hypothetical protein MUE72_00175 [Chitinophagaceae bacterium]|jgi:hypothetical protein|nr:hypothetical protein [Chitinophagaceae bacterium]